MELWTASTSGRWDRDFEGFGDAILYAKLQLLSQAGYIGKRQTMKAPLDLALQAELKLPTGDESKFLGTGKTDFALRLLAQREILPDVLRVRVEAGYNFSGISQDFSSFDYKTGVEWVPLPRQLPRLSLSGEVIGSYSDIFDNVIDGVVGAKYSSSAYSFSVFGGVRFPLNSNGLRYPVSPIVGLDKTFNFRRKTDDMPPASETTKDQGAPADAAPAAPAPADAAPKPTPAP